MTTDTRTPEERAYDDLASGAVYQKPAYTTAEYDLLISVLQRVEEHFGLDETAPAAPASSAVTLTKKDDGWYEYAAGGARLSIEDGIPTTVYAAGQLIELDEGFDGFNDFYVLLSDPTVQQLLGIAPTAPAVQVGPWDPDDKRSDRVLLSCGEGDTKAEAYLTNDKAPVLYAGVEAVSVDQAEQLAINLRTLLADPRVQAARAAYKETPQC